MECIFCDFVSGKRKRHLNGYPFKILHETPRTLSFLSLDFPAKEDGHILVIPKKHFTYVDDIPKNILHDLINHVSLVSKVLRKTHEGCNILINQGKSAGQYLFHVHFHIIPRDKGDNIKIEVWRHKKMTKAEFKKLNNKISIMLKKYKD